MIHVDDMQGYPGKGRWCHMWCDGPDEELHAFAASIGLKPEWAQLTSGTYADGSRWPFPHYDLRLSKRIEALKAGAQYMPLIEWIKIQRSRHEPPTQ